MGQSSSTPEYQEVERKDNKRMDFRILLNKKFDLLHVLFFDSDDPKTIVKELNIPWKVSYTTTSFNQVGMVAEKIYRGVPHINIETILARTWEVISVFGRVKYEELYDDNMIAIKAVSSENEVRCYAIYFRTIFNYPIYVDKEDLPYLRTFRLDFVRRSVRLRTGRVGHDCSVIHLKKGRVDMRLQDEFYCIGRHLSSLRLSDVLL